MIPSVLIGEDVDFFRDGHAYTTPDGRRVLSVTQALSIAGAIDYSKVPPDVLAHACDRGRLVHEATAMIDKGESLDQVELPSEIEPFVNAYLLFSKEMRFVPDMDWVETPLLVELFSHHIGMTPDAIGTMDGVPTLIERKTCASKHPAWSLQTAGYTLGIQRVGLQVRQRMAVQLLPTGRYKLHPHEDDGDYQTFADVYRTAAWKIKHGLATI